MIELTEEQKLRALEKFAEVLAKALEPYERDMARLVDALNEAAK